LDGFNLGDLISLIIVFALYLTAASSTKKKKKKRAGTREQRAPLRTRKWGEQADKRAIERDRKTHTGFGEAFGDVHAQDEKASCAAQPMHLHVVSQERFACAAEGEDPCHAGGASWQEDQTDELQREISFEAQDVLFGVMMSEILLRPQERAALKRGRR